MGLRDHEPFVIEEFNGLWDRGDDESCPADHFLVADNVQYFESGFETRNPLARWQNTTGLPLKYIRRIHNYVMQDGQSLLVMTRNGDIYHIVRPNSVPFLVISFPTATDFNMVSIAGRAYITPFNSPIDSTGQRYDLGLKDEFVYVYSGDGVTPARKAGGAAPTNGSKKPLIAFNSGTSGTVTKGIHQFIVTFNGGTYSPPVRVNVDAPGNEKIQLKNLPIGPVGTLSRVIAMTLAIDSKDWSADGNYPFYQAAVIPDNVTIDWKVDITDDVLKLTPAAFGTQEPLVPMMVANTSTPGFCDIGFHVVAVVYETDTGYLTGPGPEFFAANTYVDGNKKVRVYVIPVSPDPFVKKRHIISTKAITDYNGDQAGYQFFFVPGAVIDNNIDTSIEFSYYDSDLIDDASHLLDNYVNIPAGVGLTTYHGRMIVVGLSTLPDIGATPHDSHTAKDNRSVALLSAPGEPEAISKVDGLIITPLDGSPLTNAQEFRDLLYLFKRTRTYSYSDNFDEPATWQEQVLDQGIGAPVHGIGTVLDSGGVNTDFLVIVDWSGLMLFNGTYSRPELSFKIEDFWYAQDRNNFRQMQIANDSIGKKIYITLPDPFRMFMLYADYSNGLDAKNIKWARWVFDSKVTTICLIETNKLIVGVDEAVQYSD